MTPMLGITSTKCLDLYTTKYSMCKIEETQLGTQILANSHNIMSRGISRHRSQHKSHGHIATTSHHNTKSQDISTNKSDTYPADNKVPKRHIAQQPKAHNT